MEEKKAIIRISAYTGKERKRKVLEVTYNEDGTPKEAKEVKE